MPPQRHEAMRRGIDKGENRMNDTNLTKEEIRAIKKGYAYKTWSRKRSLAIGGFLVWGFAGIGLTRINNVISAVYTIGLVICVMMLFYFIVITCWKCPNCKKQLPARDVISSTTTRTPVLVKNCPCCGADLTKTTVSKE